MCEGQLINLTIKYIKTIYSEGEISDNSTSDLETKFKSFLVNIDGTNIKLTNNKLVLFGNIREDHSKAEDSFNTLKFLKDLLGGDAPPSGSAPVRPLSVTPPSSLASSAASSSRKK